MGPNKETTQFQTLDSQAGFPTPVQIVTLDHFHIQISSTRSSRFDPIKYVVKVIMRDCFLALSPSKLQRKTLIFYIIERLETFEYKASED